MIIKNIYVSGATGLVGSAVVKLLRSSGYTVYPTRYDLLERTHLISLQEFLLRDKIDLVIHCAGKVGGIKSNNDANREFYEKNYQMGCNLIDTAIDARVPYFINLASTCAYPRDCPLPFKEEVFLNFNYKDYEPTNQGYAIAKRGVADYLRIQYEDKGLTIIPCNIYGEGDKSDHIIPDLIRKFTEAKENNIKEITLYGNGRPLRQFIKNTQVAEVIRSVIRHRFQFNTVTPFELLNIACDKEYTIMQIANMVAQHVGWTGIIKWSGELGGIMQKTSDTSLFRKYYELEDMLPEFLKPNVNV